VVAIERDREGERGREKGVARERERERGSEGQLIYLSVTHTHTITQEAGAQEEGDMKQQEVAGHMRLEREVEEEDMRQRLEEGARPAYVIQSS
jgi:hypothetical protein